MITIKSPERIKNSTQIYCIEKDSVNKILNLKIDDSKIFNIINMSIEPYTVSRIFDVSKDKLHKVTITFITDSKGLEVFYDNN